MKNLKFHTGSKLVLGFLLSPAWTSSQCRLRRLQK